MTLMSASISFIRLSSFVHGQLAGFIVDGLDAEVLQSILQTVVQLVDLGGEDVEIRRFHLAVPVLPVDELGKLVEVLPNVFDGIAVEIILVAAAGIGGGRLQVVDRLLRLLCPHSKLLQREILRLGIGPGIEADGLRFSIPLHIQVHYVAQRPDGEIGGARIGDRVDNIAILVQQGLIFAVHRHRNIGAQVGADALCNSGGARAQDHGSCQRSGEYGNSQILFHQVSFLSCVDRRHRRPSGCRLLSLSPQ